MRMVSRGLGTALLVAMLGASARSQTPTECTEAVRLTSPCVGLLVPEEDAKEALRLKLRLDEQLEHETNLIKQHEIDKALWDEALQIEIDRANAYAAQLDELYEPPAFYESVWFGFVVGAIVGGVTTALVVEVVK